MTPSKYQVDIYNWIRTGKGNLLVMARAGSGKTTTILEALKFIKPNLSSLFLAYNKSTAETLASRVPSYVDAMTVHSLGAKALFKYFSGMIKITKWKNLILLDTLVKNRPELIKLPKKNKQGYKHLICNIVDLYRLHNCTDFEQMDGMLAHHGISCLNGEMDAAKELIKYVDIYNNIPCEDHEGRKKMIDFTDMIYMPVNNRAIMLRKYDWIFVDEAQDISILQQHFIRKLVKPSTRSVFVGDDFQSIYGWAGADSNAFASLAKWPNTSTLPLSVCYRCGTEIVKHTREMTYEDIESFEGNPPGVVRNGSYRDAEDGDFILCRTNRPLVGLFFDLLKEHRRCYIKGKDIGTSILQLVDKVIDKTIEDALMWFNQQLAKTREKLEKDGIERPQFHPKYYSLKERIDIIMTVCEHYDTMREAHDKIEHMFRDQGSGIVLSSIHKSKGLETDRVFVLMRELIPNMYATQPWQKRQETNLLYVMITRAKKELVYIRDWSDKI